MTHVLRTATRDVNLGLTFEVLRALGEVAQVDIANEFGHLHRLVHAEDEIVPGWYVVAVASESRVMLARHRDRLSASTRDFLTGVAATSTQAEVAVEEGIASAAVALGHNDSSARIRERDLEEALEAALHRGDLTEIGRQGSAKLETWPRVGPVDIVATGTDGRAAFELKWWGDSAAGRYQTLWDLTKLGSLLDEHAYQSAFLVAGATAAVWELDDQHTRVFDDGRHEVERLCSVSTNWWTSPPHDKTDVPAVIETASTARASFAHGGQAYEVRASRLVACEGAWRVPARVRSVP